MSILNNSTGNRSLNGRGSGQTPTSPSRQTPSGKKRYRTQTSAAPPETHQSHQTNHARVALTLIENANGPATKGFTLGEDGKLRKQAAAQIYAGNARVLEACGIKGLVEIIEQLASNQALTYGVPAVPEAKLLTQAELRRAGGIDAIARDREHFRFTEAQPGVLMLDHDPRPGYPGLDWSDIDAILCECVPGWGAVERAWRPSASAYIYRSNGEELIGRGGWRCYVIAG